MDSHCDTDDENYASKTKSQGYKKDGYSYWYADGVYNEIICVFTQHCLRLCVMCEGIYLRQHITGKMKD